MKKLEKSFTYLTAGLGLVSSLSFIVSYFILENLRPRMIRFEAITVAEEGLVNYFGVGLLLFLGFSLLSLFQIVRHFKNAKKLSWSSLFFLVLCVLALILIFGDLALLSDIGKQYRLDLAQPEWNLLYPIMAFQLISGLILTYAHLFKLGKVGRVKYVAKDINIFMVAQYLGVLCGLMGLSSVIINFRFPRPLWMIKLHTSMTTVILLIPYLLVVAYWFLVKFQEKSRQWYDEKQIQDIGKSSFLTLVSSVVVMGGLFLLNYHHLDNMVSVLWLPFYVFLVLLLFSLGNLYFTGRD